ncbi:MAG: TonB family protein [Deltaproteobacteria bacterium]|nr:TonB family protein [Deltaproteobacteria bacterium]
MKSCRQCGKQYPDSEGFCETDGAALIAAPDIAGDRLTTIISDETPGEQSLECPVCGGKALPGEVRCNYCGARLRVEGSEPAEPALSAGANTSQNYSFGESLSGPHEFGDTPVHIPEPDSPRRGRRVFTILGLSSAAIIALAAGAWFALYLGNKHPSPQAPPTPSATSQPIVKLAMQEPLRVLGDITGPPPRDADSLLKAFEDNKAGLANAYSNTLSSDPSTSDGMVIRLHILPNGRVDNGAVKISTSGNPSFDAEIVEAMTSWKFDSINGSGVTADYRVIFAPSPSAAAAVESDLNTKLASLSPKEPPEYAFSPSGATPAAVAESSPSSMPSPTTAGGGASAMPSTAVAVGTPAPAAEPTALAGLPPAPSAATPPEIMPARPRVRRPRRAPREMAALPPPKPPLIERVNSELRANRRLRRVHAYTNGSVVTIFGKVFDDNDRLMAERTVRGTGGVSAVINNLTTDTQQWEQNQTLITQALQNAGLNEVRVKVIGRDAYLSGKVKTQLDRERAVTVAQAAAPVKVRENLVTVAIGNIFGF